MKTKVNTKILKLFFALLAAFLLPATTLVAGTPKTVAGLKTVFVVASLLPVIPTEADYNDIPPISDIYSTLQPVTPKVASYDDSGTDAYETWNLLRTLSPDVPAEAGFNDDLNTETVKELAPSLPAKADYNDAN